MTDEVKNPNQRWTVTVDFKKQGVAVFTEVLGWTLENDTYFLFLYNPEFPEDPTVKVFWIKNPELLSISFRTTNI